MTFKHFVLAAALAIGLGGTAAASPLAEAAQAIAQPDTVVEFTKWKGKHGWKGGRGHHHGWNRGRRHRAYYAPPRRHYGWQRGNHYGWRHARPRGVYYRF